MTTVALAIRPRGSWKYQDAYMASLYRSVPRQSDGRLVWKLVRRLTKKSSLPQLRRMGYYDTPIGGLHNVLLTPTEVWEATGNKIQSDLASV